MQIANVRNFERIGPAHMVVSISIQKSYEIQRMNGQCRDFYFLVANPTAHVVCYLASDPTLPRSFAKLGYR